MASALFRFSALSWKDRMRTIRVARAIGKGGSRLSEISVRQWLAELGQSDAAFTRLWEPLTLATLNMDSAQAPASLLEVVLRDGFLASKEAARVGLSQVGLSQLLGEPAKTYLAGRGSQVRLRSPVKRVKFSNGVHVELVSGEVIAGKSVISAVPPNRALALFSDHPEISDQLKNASHLKPSAIVSAHLWLDQDPFSTPIVGFWGRDIHWAFRKASFSKEPLSPSSHYFSLVTSAAGIMSQISKEAYLDICRSELRAMTGRNIEIMHSVMIREPQATWVPPLTKGNCRPAAKTPIQNFALAGDWTDTGLPCTIEGAVVSGHRGADIIQAYLSSKAHPKTKSPDPDRREARAQ
jgi:phytoene dehydrogenase-like protein